jgi:chromosome segregation protein
MTDPRDKGAHFFHCDLQVHTPRDLRWSGAHAVTEKERAEYATELIQACRAKGLDAIAITDHHDFAFFPYVKTAARDERDWLDDPVPTSDQIIVFPGLELTLSAPNCQAILILDSDFPANLLQSVLTVFAISPAPAIDKHHAPIQRISADVFHGLRDLYQTLNNHDYLRGRFILLPNVSDGGNRTLLRSGFADFYKTMPCVGGYIDGPMSKLGTGNQDILRGDNREYGSKGIAIFQTSDNRRRDHADLGVHATWVKWAAPTAEALRQACLAKDSRIMQEPPQLPAIEIRSIHVSNSDFLGPIDLYFNPQYTALIGSRGTGKSTILEYLRWGLCDEHDVDDDQSSTESVGVRQQRLIDNTLKKYSATVEVKFNLNEVPHLVRRRSGTGEILLRIGDSELQPCTKEDIRTLLPIEAYSQKQLSRVGHRVDDLNRFVQSGIKTELDSIDGQIRSLVSRSRQIYGELRRKQTIEQALREDRLSIESLSKQAQNIRQSLSGLTSEQQLLLSKQPMYLEGELLVEKWDDEVRELRTAISGLSQRLSAVPSAPKSAIHTHPEANSLSSLRTVIAGRVVSLSDLALRMSEIVNGMVDAEFKFTGDYADAHGRWTDAKTRYDEAYHAAKSAASSHETQLRSLAELEQKIRTISQRISAAENEVNTLGDPEVAFRTIQTEWKRLHKGKGDLYAQQCVKLTELSDGVIRATARRGANIAALDRQLKAIMKGSGLRGQKIEDMLGRISAASDPVALWDSLLDELERLAHHTPGIEGSQRPESPNLMQCGLAEGDLLKLAEKISPETWLELALTSLDDETTFEYQTKEKEYIPFENASAGQQATALLIALLNQPGPPLVIDQPEDDLDNQIIFEIVKRVWKAKTRRQLIFSSHNANLVVNGDAELVVWCDYRVAGDFSRGRIANEGAIDIPSIRETIKTVMEGGEKAFKLRLEKYGF